VARPCGSLAPGTSSRPLLRAAGEPPVEGLLLGERAAEGPQVVSPCERQDMGSWATGKAWAFPVMQSQSETHAPPAS